MSKLAQKESDEIRKMIYGFDIEGIEKRIKKYRFGKCACMIVFLLASVYFLALKMSEGYPVDTVALTVPLLIAGVFWWKERDLIKAKDILTAPEPETQNQSGDGNSE